MKIAVIGGAGVRTPLLAKGLAVSGLPIDEIALFDIDQDRLAVIAPLAASWVPAVRPYRDARASVAGAQVVFLSIRVGGIAARARDEAIAVEHGIAGQETIGPGGFAMAMRTVPAAVAYARLIESEAPTAWIINFTNPVSIVTQAMAAATGGARIVGICDTPIELFEDVARILEVDSSRCHFDYFGLNHLGWLREVYCDGVPQLARLWGNRNLLKRVYRAPLFDPAFLESLHLLPSEYLFYYYRPDAALDNLRRAGQTRGAAVAGLTDRLFKDLTAPGADRRQIYEAYLHARHATYMTLESGSTAAKSPASAATGYDRIAVRVVQALHLHSNAMIPLNVRNRGAVRDLDADDVVEVPCVVNANGAQPLAVGDVPESVLDLVMRVKDFEWLTIHAASTQDDADAVLALTRNPLVDDGALAATLVQALKPW